MKTSIMKMRKEIIYIILTIIYLVKLNILNKELLSCNFNNSFELLQYKNYTPVIYFAIAIALFFIGCFLEYRRFSCIWNQENSFEEIMLSLLALLLMPVLLILLIALIKIPILKAIFTIVGIITGVGALSNAK